MADRSPLSVPHRYSMVAAAQVLSAQDVSNPVKVDGMLPWQERAWNYYDNVGEYRFGVNWLSNGLSRVNLVAARPPRQVGDEPQAIRLNDETTTPDERRAAQMVESIAGGASGQGQLLGEFGQHLAIAGLGWLVAEPNEATASDAYESWQVLAQDSLRITTKGQEQIIEMRIGHGSNSDAWRRLHSDALVVKTWRKHPRRWWEPDAPVRAVLGVLDQIDLLGAHITATGRSRLAGAGVFAIPSEAEFPPPPDEADGTPSVTDSFDYFVQQLTEAMTVPITNRDSAAGVVPLVLSVPGEYIERLAHITFSTPFDARVTELLKESIKRLALGLDMPPEVLTGMAGVNHWTAWQVEETAITLHIEPNAEIVCNALTEGFLAPALQGEGIDPSIAMVWYDTSDLTSPPDRSGNAQANWDRLVLSDAALRRESGFSEEDAPTEYEYQSRVLLDMAKSAPADYFDALVERELIPSGSTPTPTADSSETVQVDETTVDVVVEGPPSADNRPGSAAVLMACDGIVYRAMERAGARLKSSIGRRTEGGPAAISCDDIALLHLQYDPTVYADLDMLLTGAFDRVDELAPAIGLTASNLTETLTAYCKGLLAAQHPHTRQRLIAALDPVI